MKRTTPAATHCPYCALQCGMTVAPGSGAEPARVAGREDFPVNEGALCGKGAAAAAVLDPAVRLTVPLVRDAKDAPLRPATWDEALERVAREFAARPAAAVGIFGGGGLTNEKAYLLGKFARAVLRTPNIDYNGRFCMSSAAFAQLRAFGVDRGLPFPVRDLRETGAILLVGANVADTMPPILRHFTAQRDAGGWFAVVDPRRTRTAEQADVHVQPVPGTDLALANGLLHIVVATGLCDEEYVAARTSGFEEVRRMVAGYWPERVEQITGVPAAQLRLVAEELADAARSGRGAMILTARGSEQHSDGAATVSAWINLALALGLPGRPHSGYAPVTGQGNGQGGREHGQKCDQLPGYRKLDDPDARKHVAAVWGIDPSDLPGPGPSAVELLDRCGAERADRIDALLVMGSNPVVSAPAAGDLEDRLRDIGFLAVADLVLSETAALADVVLPAAQWAEETGTTTNLEGRILLRERALTPPPGVRTDLQIIDGLAARLGRPLGDDPAEVFAELGEASRGGMADYSAVTHQRLRDGAELYWPCGIDTPEGTPRLFTERFATPDGRARFNAVQYQGAAEEPDAAYPYRLTTGRVLSQYQSGAQTRRVDVLNRAAPEPFVELHPDLAAAHAIAEGELVAVTSRRGTATAPARLSRAIRPDTVFMPFHWPGAGRANTVTNPALDPHSKMPAFKVCAVRIGAAAGPDGVAP
ncbi:molybdopterin-dependent oxidoreductase [Actinospica robiniae]